MSKVFPNEKDNVIDDLDERYVLDLTDEEYDRLRGLRTQDLLLFTVLLSRARKAKATD